MNHKTSVFVLSAAITLASALPAFALAAQIEIKTTEVGLVCPTTNEEARRSYNDAHNSQDIGRLAEAEKAYQKAVELDPAYCDAMDNLGRLLRVRGDIKGAVSWYKRSLSIKPDNPIAHQNLAAAYLYQGDRAGAEIEYQWLIHDDPKNPEGHYGLGNLYVGMEKPDAAIQPLKRAEELYIAASSPFLPDVRYVLGTAFFQLSEYMKAKEYLLLAYPEMSNHPGINYFLGLCYLDPATGDKAQAKRYIRKAREAGVKIPAEILEMTGE